MLGKLIKYDFKWINKIMFIYFIVLIILSIVLKIVEGMYNDNQTFLLLIMDKTVSAMYIGALVSTLITCIMRIWGRYISNLYKDESYLTHTLPVTKNQIFNAKVISSILSLSLSCLVVGISLAITYFNKSTIESTKLMFDSLFEVYGKGFGLCFIGGGVLLIFLEIVYFMMAGVFGIIIGFRFNNFKLIKSIIIGLISYGVFSSLSFLIISIASKFTDYDIIGNGFPTSNILKVMGITSILVYFAYIMIYYLVSKKVFNKGVNVD